MHAMVYNTADAQAHQPSAESQVPLPPKLGGAEIRERFLQFFEKHQHVRLPSSSLIPDDPTVLLTIAGMLQFKSIFMGQVRESMLPAWHSWPRLHHSAACLLHDIAGQEEAHSGNNHSEVHTHK